MNIEPIRFDDNTNNSVGFTRPQVSHPQWVGGSLMGQPSGLTGLGYNSNDFLSQRTHGQAIIYRASLTLTGSSPSLL